MENSLHSFSENDKQLFEIFFSDNPEATEHRRTMQNFTRLMAYYKCAMMELETKFNVLNEEFSLKHDRTPISSIKTRLKKLDSMILKLSKKQLPMSISSLEENINDIAGIRVTCSFIHDVYMLADALLMQDDITLIEIKDYIKNPKPNGYRSLHLIVSVPIFLLREKRSMKVEIQLRTIAMDSWAALEHQLKYKKDNNFTDEMAKDLFLCSQLSTELDKRMDSLREKVNI